MLYTYLEKLDGYMPIETSKIILKAKNTNNISTDMVFLNKQQIQELEPDLTLIYEKEMWIENILTASDPLKLSQSYLQLNEAIR